MYGYPWGDLKMLPIYEAMYFNDGTSYIDSIYGATWNIMTPE